MPVAVGWMLTRKSFMRGDLERFLFNRANVKPIGEAVRAAGWILDTLARSHRAASTMVRVAPGQTSEFWRLTDIGRRFAEQEPRACAGA